MECSNCHHHFQTNEEAAAGGFSFGVLSLFISCLIIFCLINTSTSLSNYYHVVPQSDISFSSAAILASGLNSNATSYPVFHVIMQFTGNHGSSVCLRRKFTTISYSGITVAKSLEPKKGYTCYDTYGDEDEFDIKVVGSAINLPSSLNKEKSLFDVDIELEGRNHLAKPYYRVSCKSLPLKATDSAVPCQTTKVSML